MTLTKFNDRGFLMSLTIGLLLITNSIALVIEARPGAGAIALLLGLLVIAAGQLVFPPSNRPTEHAYRQAAGLDLPHFQPQIVITNQIVHLFGEDANALRDAIHEAQASSMDDLMMADYASLSAHDKARVDAYEQFMIERHTIA